MRGYDIRLQKLRTMLLLGVRDREQCFSPLRNAVIQGEKECIERIFLNMRIRLQLFTCEKPA